MNNRQRRDHSRHRTHRRNDNYTQHNIQVDRELGLKYRWEKVGSYSFLSGRSSYFFTLNLFGLFLVDFERFRSLLEAVYVRNIPDDTRWTNVKDLFHFSRNKNILIKDENSGPRINFGLF